MIFEFPPTGGMITSTNIRPVKLIRYASGFDYFVMACECIFCVFILYYIIEELLEVFACVHSPTDMLPTGTHVRVQFHEQVYDVRLL